ncbi:MAG: hypothetical protein EHM58_05315 [Ignavibacteriae bacterium]|nr:MAG: hypothetical protein EHM58_05315 [Ignavibacteriota bacterium]
MYTKESQLVKDFQKKLKTTRKKNVKCLNFATEFNYRSGKTDIIGITKDGFLIAFEAKLYKWKDALHQAYKNTIYAHYSYVVLPDKTATIALKFIDEFEKRGIGLCTINQSSIIVHIEAIKNCPYSVWLTEHANNYIENA